MTFVLIIFNLYDRRRMVAVELIISNVSTRNDGGHLLRIQFIYVYNKYTIIYKTLKNSFENDVVMLSKHRYLITITELFSLGARVCMVNYFVIDIGDRRAILLQLEAIGSEIRLMIFLLITKIYYNRDRSMKSLYLSYGASFVT